MISRYQLFFYSLIFFLAGIILGNFFIAPVFFIFCWFLLFLFLSLVNGGNKRSLFIFLAVFLLGIIRYQVSLPTLDQINRIYNLSGQQKFIGLVVETRDNSGWQGLVLETSLVADKKSGLLKPVSGKVYLTALPFPKYRPGDELKIECLIENYKLPPVGYDRYLFKDNIFSRCRFAEINRIGQRSSIRHYLAVISDYLKVIISSSTAEPAASILNGILLNRTTDIPDSINNKLSALGLTHIIAISGSHLVIFIVILTEIFIMCGLSRLRSFWPTILIIIFYVGLVGAPASAVRSAIMVIIIMSAQKMGRLASSANLLILAAVVMAIINPKVIIYDIGFQLSFLAVVGLVYLTPLIKNSLRFWPVQTSIKEMIAATLSAQIATYPLIIYYFGNFSAWSLVANLLILPTVPFLMSLGIIQIFLGIFIKFLALKVGLLSWLIIEYWLLVVDILVSFPAAQLVISGFSFLFLFLTYLIMMIAVSLALKSKKKLL